MNNNNNKFKKRGQDLLNELKQFTIDVNSNTTNKQTQLNTILFEIKTIENKIQSIEDDFLADYRKIVGQEFANKPVDFPKIMKMDGYLIKIRFEKNKQNRIRQLEQNKLNENQKRANEAKTLNISQKTDFIKSEIKRLRQNIGNVNTSNNSAPPLNIFANNTARAPNQRPSNQVVAANAVRQRVNNLISKISTLKNKNSLTKLKQSVNVLQNSPEKASALARINNKLNLLNTAERAGL
jgi:hypothetical protein